MKSRVVIPLLLCVLCTLVAAWTKEDHEIFRLHDEVRASEGPDTTFYSFLDVPSSASSLDIEKAARKKSKLIHPDKARQSYLATYNRAHSTSKPGQQKKKKPGVTVRKQPSQKEIAAFVKEATERYARLTVVSDLLRSPARERYDHFLRHGFPKWRGTGYYYERYRPGLGSVLVGLFIVGGGLAHYAAMYIGWKRQRDFVDRYIRHARQLAWGDEVGIRGIPGVGAGVGAATPSPHDSGMEDGAGQAMNWNRRQKRMQEKESRRAAKSSRAVRTAKTAGISTPVDAELTSGPEGVKKRVQAPNGKVLIVDSVGNVFLEEETGDGQTHEYLLDVDEIPKPTVYQTVLFRLPVWVYNQSMGRVLGRSSSEPVALDEDGEEVDVNGNEESMLKTATAATPNSEARKRKPKVRQR